MMTRTTFFLVIFLIVFSSLNVRAAWEEKSNKPIVERVTSSVSKNFKKVLHLSKKGFFYAKDFLYKNVVNKVPIIKNNVPKMNYEPKYSKNKNISYDHYESFSNENEFQEPNSWNKKITYQSQKYIENNSIENSNNVSKKYILKENDVDFEKLRVRVLPKWSIKKQKVNKAAPVVNRRKQRTYGRPTNLPTDDYFIPDIQSEKKKTLGFKDPDFAF